MSQKEKKQDTPIPNEEPSAKELEAQKIITMFPRHFSFNYPTKKNIDALRTLTRACLPVHYRDWFYDAILDRPIELCRCVYFNDLLVGAICTRMDDVDKLYIMSITVLKSFRRMKIGTYLMKYVENYAHDHENIKEIMLHVHTINQEAISFYTNAIGFEKRKEIPDYYHDLTPSSCFELVKVIRE